MSSDLRGQVAVVTGGARGLGLSMAHALARNGVRIALFDLLEQVENSAAELANDHDVATLGLTADVTSDTDLAEAFRVVSERLATPTILVNAAGITVWGDSLDTERDVWQKVIDVNLTGTFLACQAFGRGCRSAGLPGVVVNVSSMSAQVVNVPQHQASYHASKAGVEMLSKALAVEWAGLGIRVNAIAPGYFLSDMTKEFTDANPELAERWRSMIPLGRMGMPHDLDGLVTFLCSESSAYLTGQSIVIDGAYTAI
ncbi:MAG: family oxidoreductase [Pseudonocardiales bacterium]|jgi:NAD(P)-dependent dehydrogenase (short-subunit alcohol dehydrogenase family)|nr:family oxidoreductase [Pseudonocardiales bacterium]